MEETMPYHELGQEVAVSQIDKSLRALWAVDETRTNACLINFAVYSERAGSLINNSAIVRELMREHACRAILIEMDRSAAAASIRAWVTAHCYISAGRKSVCCEQIAFALTGVSRGRLRNTVFAHLSSDLPLIFWWQGELSPIFEERLYSVVDRFVFDSTEWSKPADSFAIIMNALQQNSRTMVIQDLAWTRSFHFRLALANLFDDPLAMKSLDKVREVEIVCHPDHRSSALLLVAWMKTQCRWKTGLELKLAVSRKSANASSFSFESQLEAPIDVTVRCDADAAPLGAMQLRGDDVLLSVNRQSHATHLNLTCKIGNHHSESLQPAGSSDQVSLIGEQLARGGKNSLYLKVLPAFLELLD